MIPSNELLKSFVERLKSDNVLDETLLQAVEGRLNNELTVATRLAETLVLMPCACTREHPYHGKGVKMCVRCRSLVLWETLQTGRSAVQEHFDKVIPK